MFLSNSTSKQSLWVFLSNCTLEKACWCFVQQHPWTKLVCVFVQQHPWTKIVCVFVQQHLWTTVVDFLSNSTPELGLWMYLSKTPFGQSLWLFFSQQHLWTKLVGVLFSCTSEQSWWVFCPRVPLNKACGCFVQLHIRTKLASVFVQQHLWTKCVDFVSNSTPDIGLWMVKILVLCLTVCSCIDCLFSFFCVSSCYTLHDPIYSLLTHVCCCQHTIVCIWTQTS